MDLVKLISDKVNEVNTSGKMNEIIEKHVIECVDDIVKDSFRWSGEAKKQIEEVLKDKLGIALDKVKIPQYNKIVAKIVNEQLNKTVSEDVRLSIIETCNKVTGVLDKKEYKLSEIISAYIEDIDKSYDGSMDDQYGELTLHVRPDSNWCWIDFDKESNKESYQCESRIFLYKGKISGATIGGIPASPFSTKNYHGFEGFLFNLYCSNASIIVDEDKCETEYSREDANY